MNIKQFLLKNKSVIFLIFFAVILRLLPHLPNVAPVGALALFAGAHYSKKMALIIPVTVMIITDSFLGFHSSMVWVYGSFVLISMLGILLKNKTSPKNILFASLGSSILFYLITNFGVWIATEMYPKNLEGLMQSFVMGLPFLRYTFIGDLIYTAAFFGGYALIYPLTMKINQKFYLQSNKRQNILFSKKS